MKPRNSKKLIRIFLMPMLIFYVGFTIYPFLLNILYSFLNWNGITKTANFIGWENYRQLIGNGIFWNAVKNSLLYALFGTTFQILISFLLAYLVEFGSFKRKKLLRILFILPIVATTATMGMMMKSFFNHEGLLNTFLTSIGLSAQPFLTDPKYVFGVVILVSVWKETGTLFIYWLAGFQMVSEEVVEAAKIDGVTTFSLLTKIIMPMIKPVVVMITTVTFLNSLKVFDLIQTMTAGGPYFATDVLSTFIYRTAFSSSFGSPQLSYASSAAVVAVLLTIIMSLIFHLISQKRKGEVS
ncbi:MULTISPECIES: carbohydrate ABC transporter permease [Enterococcus]|uniref:carbohydrate ABC transporter permease n=1 Tax=Enterococcus TaxID=1350 RepID=UPI001558C09C|nr:sugar ABC transporter permease [Enterococcus gallinarum]NQE03754.1 sugar ABC transporter permease [Enterococcus gallinarum]